MYDFTLSSGSLEKGVSRDSYDRRSECGGDDGGGGHSSPFSCLLREGPFVWLYFPFCFCLFFDGYDYPLTT